MPPPSSVTLLVVGVREVQVPVGPLLREHHHADDAARAAVPLDRLLQRALDKVDRLGLLHAFPPVRVAVAVDVRRPGPANGVRLLVQRAAQRDRVYLSAVALVPARDDEAGPVRFSCQRDEELKTTP